MTERTNNKLGITVLYNHIGLKPDDEYVTMSFVADQEMIDEALAEYNTPMFTHHYHSVGDLRWNTEIWSKNNLIMDNVYQYLHEVVNHTDIESDPYVHMRTHIIMKQIITMMYHLPKCRHRFDKKQTHGYVLCLDAIYRHYHPSLCFYIDGNVKRRPLSHWYGLTYELENEHLTKHHFKERYDNYWEWLKPEQRNEVELLRRIIVN